MEYVQLKHVIVVGSGIVGAVTSYQLARRNIKVTIIDSREIGRSTYVAAGMINPWTTKRRNKAWYQLATLGAKFYDELIPQLIEDGESNTGYKRNGAIHLHNDEHKLHDFFTTVRERREDEAAIGEVQLLDKEQTYELFPFTNKNYKGVYISGIGSVNGQLLVDALIRAAVKRGATEIVGRAQLIVKNKVVTGVIVNNDAIQADAVVLANGIWMPTLLADTDINMDLIVRKGEIIHLQTTAETDHLPVVIPPSNKYILPSINGRIVVGTTFIRTDFASKDVEFTTSGIHEILNETLIVAPKLQSSTISDMKVGFRPYTASSLPLFGPVPHINRLYAANGLGASGLSTGPMIGLQLAKLLNEEPLDVSLSKYSLNEIISRAE